LNDGKNRRAFFYFIEKFSYVQNGSENMKMGTIFLRRTILKKRGECINSQPHAASGSRFPVSDGIRAASRQGMKSP